MSKPTSEPEPQSFREPEASDGSDGAAPQLGGHRRAVAELVREHNRTLHAFLMARLHDEHEARNVVQEA